MGEVLEIKGADKSAYADLNLVGLAVMDGPQFDPEKVQALEKYGLTVTERVAIEIPPRNANRKYLQTKRTKFGHLLSLVGADKEEEEE